MWGPRSAELRQPGYAPRPIALGANTDPYQPLEKRLRVTRRILEVLAAARHPVGIVTKSALVCRDLDLLAPMARDGLVNVHVSITSLEPRIARTLEFIHHAGETNGLDTTSLVPSTWHPLGGASMGEVCDLAGRVRGHRGLYVLDGALMPGTSAACNPSMTIAAVAERAMDELVVRDVGAVF